MTLVGMINTEIKARKYAESENKYDVSLTRPKGMN